MTGKEFSFSPVTITFLKNIPWYGNVRELENSIVTAIINSEDGLIQKQHFSDFIDKSDIEEEYLTENITLKDFRTEELNFKKSYYKRLLEENNWNISKAAKTAGISRQSLHNIIKALEL